MARIKKVHKCSFTSTVVAEFRNKSTGPTSTPMKMVPGSGITVWEQKCSCGNTHYSVSHWESSALSQGHANMGGGQTLTVRTPPKTVPVGAAVEEDPYTKDVGKGARKAYKKKVPQKKSVQKPKKVEPVKKKAAKKPVRKRSVRRPTKNKGTTNVTD